MNSSAAAGQGMLCPVCKVTLSISDRQGVEIDFCPQCRGVWLDRGELDKIVERSEAVMPIQSRGDSQPPRGRSGHRSEEHTSELQSLTRTSYAVFCLKKTKQDKRTRPIKHTEHR